MVQILTNAIAQCNDNLLILLPHILQKNLIIRFNLLLSYIRGSLMASLLKISVELLVLLKLCGMAANTFEQKPQAFIYLPSK